MIEDQIPNIPVIDEKPKRKWVIWLAAGGCAVFLCAAVFIGALIILGPDIVQKFFPHRCSGGGGASA